MASAQGLGDGERCLRWSVEGSGAGAASELVFLDMDWLMDWLMQEAASERVKAEAAGGLAERGRGGSGSAPGEGQRWRRSGLWAGLGSSAARAGESEAGLDELCSLCSWAVVFLSWAVAVLPT